MAGNLFLKLLSLHKVVVPEEDFFTEVVAWLFEHENNILADWLSKIFGIGDTYSYYLVRTQVTYPKLLGHSIDSRPDIVIEMYRDNHYDVVFIESKIGSEEGPDQLSRYADQLCHSYPDSNRYLLYITRYFDPKDVQKICKRASKDFNFEQVQWSDFYSFLLGKSNVAIVPEILEFMKGKGMAKIDRLTPAVLVGFSTFDSVYNFMQQSLDGEIEHRLEEIMGRKVASSELGRIQQLRPSCRRYMAYVYANNRDRKNEWSAGLGYLFPQSLDGSPALILLLEGQPNAARSHQIIASFREIVTTYSDNDFVIKGANLDAPGKYAQVIMTYPLEKVLQEESHERAINHRFSCFLDILQDIKSKWPILWGDGQVSM